MRVALLFDGASALGASPDLLVVQTVEAIETALINEGNSVVRVPVLANGKWIDRMKRGRFDVAFNMCEGIDGVAELEPPVIAVRFSASNSVENRSHSRSPPKSSASPSAKRQRPRSSARSLVPSVV